MTAKEIYIQQSTLLTNLAYSDFPSSIEYTANFIIEAFRAGKKLLIAGNGGSAADAQHFAAELINRFETERSALPAIALTTDTSVLTSISNDYSFDYVFSRQIEALGQMGDILFVISTSGNSQNIILAIEKAKEKGLTVIGLTGRNGGLISAQCDISIVIPENNTARIQEVNLITIHIICKIIDGVIL